MLNRWLERSHFLDLVSISDFHFDRKPCPAPRGPASSLFIRVDSMVYFRTQNMLLRHHWKHVDHCEGGSCHGDLMLLGYL